MTTHCELCNRELSVFRAINNTPICSRCEADQEFGPEPDDESGRILERMQDVAEWEEQRLQEDLDRWTMEEEGTVKAHRPDDEPDPWLSQEAGWSDI